MGTNMSGLRTMVLAIVFSLFSFSAFSQSLMSGDGKYEYGFGLGPLFFLGDLGGNYGVGKGFVKDLNLPLTKVAKGLYVNVYPAEWLGFRFAANHGVLEGDDSETKSKGGPEQDRLERNLKFKSSMIEAYFAMEFYPTVFFERYDGLKGKLRPYGIGGVGALRYDPKGEYFDGAGNGTWVKLTPLRLEGQGMAEYPNQKKPSNITMIIPMGFGAKYYLKDDMYIGLEVLHRTTFSDYIDNVSSDYYIDPNLFANYLDANQTRMANQLYYRRGFVPGAGLTRAATADQRGDPTQNDAYFSTILRFGWRLNDSRSPNGRALRQLRCPAFY